MPAHNTLTAYHVPVTRLEVKAVYTNSIPGGSMRAPGDPQSMFASECHVDMIARSLGIDPIELRRRNALKDGEPSVTGERVHRARAIEVLDALERESGWSAAAGAPVAGGASRSACGTSAAAGGGRHASAGRAARWKSRPASPTRVAARTPCCAASPRPSCRSTRRRVIVRHCDTAGPAPDPGVGGQRITHVLGRAAQSGATELKAKLEDLAAEAMGWPAGQVRLEGDRLHRRRGSGIV